MTREEVKLDLTPGLLYRTDLRNGCPAGLYRVVGLGKHAHSFQELVALRREGVPNSQLWFVNLAAFLDRFKRVAEVAPEPKAEKTVNITEGSGF